MNISLSSALRLAAAASVAATIAGCGPNDGLAELDSGKAAYAAQDLKKAVKLFEKSLEFAPDRIDTLVYLARARQTSASMRSGASLRLFSKSFTAFLTSCASYAARPASSSARPSSGSQPVMIAAADAAAASLSADESEIFIAFRLHD